MTRWWVVILTGATAFGLKYLGHLVPARWLANERLRRINEYVPVALLSALVVAEGLVDKTRVVIDHRAIGLGVAAVALLARAPFFVVVILAALASAIAVHLG